MIRSAMLLSLLLLPQALPVLDPIAVAATVTQEQSWWSLEPLSRPPVPIPSASLKQGQIRNPIDSFILASLAEKNLSPSEQASRAVLLRRLFFDLTGLPPTSEDVAAFVSDPDPLAYEKLVDRLLASPAYGERWARHWLDVVHFGETHGYDKDKPRPNAWPYRDYIIRSLNDDKPYWRFVQEQVAGDVLFPETRDGIEALGFISAGPWDFIGHAEVPESKIDGRIARHLDRDDMVSNTIQTFNSLTVQCAQCHNHKFDPISMEEYYRLQAVFAAVDRTDLKYDTDPETGRKRSTLNRSRSQALARKAHLIAAIEERAGDEFKQLIEQIKQSESKERQRSAFGYHSQISNRPDEIKWVQIDLGKTTRIDRIVIHAASDDFNGIGDGFGFPSKYRVQASEDPEFIEKVQEIADRTSEVQKNPALAPVSLVPAAGKTIQARYVRLTATQLAHRKEDYILALAELEVFSSHGTNVALRRSVSSKDSIDAPPRWAKPNLTDGWWPGGGDLEEPGKPSLASLRERREALFQKHQTPAEARQIDAAEKEGAEANRGLAALPPQSVVYAGAVHTGSGAFSGTGAQGGKPRKIHLLNRGNVQKTGDEVGPGTLQALKGISGRFDLAPGHKEGDRRAALARWLTDPQHPLTWRSIVNRVWQYHFGRGIVETPNDFGRMGGRPSHPALLDWLGAEFRDNGQSLKKLHRLIVTSSTYRQSSRGNPENERLDSDNRYLWRMNRRKLEAETIRDSMLAASGAIDRRMFGPSFQDFVIEKPEHSPHYEYHLHNPEDPRALRRSVYRFLVRSQPQPFMTVLDCADPSMQVPKRNESLSPLQSLSMLNNPLVLSLASRCATRARTEAPDLPSQVRRIHELALSRTPSPSEHQMLVGYAGENGLENTARLLFNVNEFMFVD